MAPTRTLSTVLLPLVALAGGGFAWAQSTARVSVATGGAQADSACQFLSISADGRYVAFASSATTLVVGDTNGCRDVFVRDRQNGTTERVSVSSAGLQANNASGYAGVSISADGRCVAFESSATNLVAGDTNGHTDIFVHDRLSGTTERVSVASGGAQSNDGYSYRPSISADGRFVAFNSDATDLVLGDTNGAYDVFVHDRQSGITERVSVDSAGLQGNGASGQASISGAGDVVAFLSDATNLVAWDTNGSGDIFVRDRLNGTTERVSVSSAGAQGNGVSILPAISADGRCVAFHSVCGNLVAGDTNGYNDVFVRDRQLGTTELVSLSSGGLQGNQDSGLAGRSISADGRFVAFQSDATNLVGGDTNGFSDVFLRDRQSGTTERVSLDTSGLQGNQDSGDTGGIAGVAISADGRFVAFESLASNLVAGDTNGVTDVFLRDRDATSFASQCEPGTGGVIACPCANPPSGAGRGCDNSSGTGGASLAAAGAAQLSSDTLVFTTSGEKPTATSIVLQGTSAIPSGVIFGQGVRCASGALKRLYVHNAVGGSIRAPVGADLSVSARSAQLGDPIAAGSSRYYGVYYRDPTVLGGCPATSTFNVTQGGAVAWQL
jgi:Tol biopolymer transport system component